ncbi:response regulator [Tengunoibacter tsumagoiensis]|uniref:Response regulatory domain-containing protein n=1 Tax=Tengunoibacter tsumagoiensis TaxID=2014871 RepID=A0A402AAX6_9CHLR|nr:response regulator [Tengunoibacter tsumagoiensis]GCE16091.1 hypothetical protein KTT_59500 [Tengunoibacter tsumagoiensis]
MGIRIIIADNDPLQRAELGKILIKWGYEIVGETGEGWSVVKLARELRPDVVITDIILPDMNGIVVAGLLRQEKIAPVIVSTTMSNPDLIKRAKDAGVLNYLIKPVRESEIAFAVEHALTRYQSYLKLQEQNRLLTQELELRKLDEKARGIRQEQQDILKQRSRSNLSPRFSQAAFFSLDREIEHILYDLEHLHRGYLTLGVSPQLGLSFLHSLAAEYEALYPGVRIHYVVADMSDLLSRTVSMEIDLTFLCEDVHSTGIFSYIWRREERNLYIIRATRASLSKAARVFLRHFLQHFDDH